MYNEFFLEAALLVQRCNGTTAGSVADPDPGSGMGESQHPDPGSGMNNPDHIF